MSLYCFCDFEPSPGDIMWHYPSDYIQLDTARGRKCCSCLNHIKPGDLAIRFRRYKVPEHDVEIRIYGETDEDGPARASVYHCEKCADLFFSLDELGYCINIYEDMRQLVREYAEMHEERMEREMMAK